MVLEKTGLFFSFVVSSDETASHLLKLILLGELIQGWINVVDVRNSTVMFSFNQSIPHYFTCT